MALTCAFGLKVKAGRKVVQPLTRTNASTLAQANKNAAALQKMLTEDRVYGKATVTVTAHTLSRWSA